MKLGFIGTGDIAEAVITGILHAGLPVETIAVSARSRHISARLAAADPRVTVCEENQQVVDAADLVFLSVLPQQLEAVLSPLVFRPDHEISSLVATVPAARVAAWSGAAGPVTRAIPLPPVARCAAVTVLSGHSERLETIFGALGGAIVTDSQDQFDALTMPGCLMGVFFGLQEVITGWMGDKGVAEPDARRFLSSLFLELARTGAASEHDFATLRDHHSTPGGLNAQAFEVFAGEGGAEALRAAMDSVTARIRAASAD